jgi:hypothetical protein
MNNKNQIIGGISGIIEASLYIFGFTILFSILQPTMDETKTGLDKLKFIIDNKSIYQTWILFIYVLFGIVLVPLTVAINENFKEQTTIWTKITPVFGFIWSGLVIASGMIGVIGIDSVTAIYNSDSNSALTSWKIIEAIQNGLGGGVEIIGGLWVFLISMTSIKQSAFNKFLNYFGLIVGSAGILTIIPSLKDLGTVFGLTQIVWFLWIGIVMIKNGRKN